MDPEMVEIWIETCEHLGFDATEVPILKGRPVQIGRPYLCYTS